MKNKKTSIFGKIIYILLYSIIILSLIMLLGILLHFAKQRGNNVATEVEWENLVMQETMTESCKELESGECDGIVFQGKEYDNPDVFFGSRDSDEAIEIPCIDDNLYEIFKTAYGEIDFIGEFKRGNLEVYDSYKEIFKKVLNNETTLLDTRIGKEIYWKDMKESSRDGDECKLSDYDDDEYEYYFFDMDEDGSPELCIRIRKLFWVYFRYDPQLDKCVVWYYEIDGRKMCSGSRKILSSDGKDIVFQQLNNKGEVECTVIANVTNWSIEESLHLVTLPVYADKGKEVIVTEELKKHGIYACYNKTWYFSVTRAQYRELFKECLEEDERLYEERMKVGYTYEELFGT